jgi:hypothetical protein
MGKKYNLSKQVPDSETSRRAFLRTGVAAAGAVLLGATARVATAAEVESEDEEDEVCQALFVQTAKGVKLTKDSVTLKDPSDTLIFFCDRPKREAGFLTWEAFTEAVSSGENSFTENPPNAALTVVDKDGQIHELVLFLIDTPVKEKSKITFPVEYIIGGPYPIDGAVTMFIDPIGRPLSPTSAAGVHRRHKRRHVRRVVH